MTDYPCSLCNGTGWSDSVVQRAVHVPCRRCRGTGRVTNPTMEEAARELRDQLHAVGNDVGSAVERWLWRHAAAIVWIGLLAFWLAVALLLARAI